MPTSFSSLSIVVMNVLVNPVSLLQLQQSQDFSGTTSFNSDMTGNSYMYRYLYFIKGDPPRVSNPIGRLTACRTESSSAASEAQAWQPSGKQKRSRVHRIGEWHGNKLSPLGLGQTYNTITGLRSKSSLGVQHSSPIFRAFPTYTPT